MSAEPLKPPLIMPLGDRGMLVRFGDALSEPANRAAIGFGRRAAAAGLPGVVEIVPNLVSVLLRYEPQAIDFERLAGEVRLLVSAPTAKAGAEAVDRTEHRIPTAFDGEDIAELADMIGLSVEAFVAAHCAQRLRVLATGFAPGFIYCGFHEDRLHVPRRSTVRRQVPSGTVLFAAGQTAVTSTAIPTGWHVIGHTDFRNFDVSRSPPVRLQAGDNLRFEVIR